MEGESMSLREERELKLLEENMEYCQNNKQWTILYPWIKDPTLLPDNKGGSVLEAALYRK